MDCAGVPNGDKVVDLCSNCKAPTDATFNVGCGSKLGDLTPLVAFAPTGGIASLEITVAASDLKDSTVSCGFEDGKSTK